mgnify:FL=1|jgi:hypothetical protein
MAFASRSRGLGAVLKSLLRSSTSGTSTDMHCYLVQGSNRAPEVLQVDRSHSTPESTCFVGRAPAQLLYRAIWRYTAARCPAQSWLEVRRGIHASPTALMPRKTPKFRSRRHPSGEGEPRKKARGDQEFDTVPTHLLHRLCSAGVCYFLGVWR